jgi:hypothetical protein
MVKNTTFCSNKTCKIVKIGFRCRRWHLNATDDIGVSWSAWSPDDDGLCLGFLPATSKRPENELAEVLRDMRDIAKRLREGKNNE